ncbi:ComF family protein [Methylophaga sp.]|uniref:ComF family protein n=1 Tax=Methylophaga sp. TaxID=2024840 RepID=UPI003F69AEBF
MAIFSSLTHQLQELYRKVFPIPCLLCGLASDQHSLCQACIAELPVVGQACVRCAIPLENAQICGRCLQSAPYQDISFSLYRYEGGVRRCITAFKYNKQLHLGPLFANKMAEQLSSRSRLPDCLVSIPLHPRRIRQRGYNQSAEVAKDLALALNLNYRPDLLRRVRFTLSQSELPFKQRKKNMRNAFACTNTQVPKHIAIIDDVMTSGFTVGEAARLLKRQGVEIIEVWTIARAISHY